MARLARSIDVVSAAFEGKSAVDRQRMVYKAIWMELQARMRWRWAADTHVRFVHTTSVVP